MKKSSRILSVTAITCAAGTVATTVALALGMGAATPAAQAADTHTATSKTAFEITTETVATINPVAPPAGSVFASVEDKRDIRCYFLADLTTEYPVSEDPAVKMPPYITSGIMEVGFDAKNDPTPDDKNAGMLQVNDPVRICARMWDTGDMNPNGITDSLIPQGFVSPKPVMLASYPRDRGPDGKPFPPHLVTNVPGHYIPTLAECVIENTVAVIPGDGEVCAQLGLPVLQR